MNTEDNNCFYIIKSRQLENLNKPGQFNENDLCGNGFFLIFNKEILPVTCLHVVSEEKDSTTTKQLIISYQNAIYLSEIQFCNALIDLAILQPFQKLGTTQELIVQPSDALKIPEIYEVCDEDLLYQAYLKNINLELYQPMEIKKKIFHNSFSYFGKKVLFKINEGIICCYDKHINFGFTNLTILPGESGSAIYSEDTEKQKFCLGIIEANQGSTLSFYGYEFGSAMKQDILQRTYSQFIPILRIVQELKSRQNAKLIQSQQQQIEVMKQVQQ